MKITTQRNLLAIALVVGASGGIGTCVAQTPAGPCPSLEITVTSSPELLEAIAAVCAEAAKAACPTVTVPECPKCPDCNCPDPPEPCCSPPAFIAPLGPPNPEPVSILLDLTAVPQLDGAAIGVAVRKWRAPVWVKAGVGSFREYELVDGDNYRTWTPASLGAVRSTVYTIGAVWQIR